MYWLPKYIVNKNYCDGALANIKTRHIKISKRISPHGHLTPVVGQVAHYRHDNFLHFVLR